MRVAPGKKKLAEANSISGDANHHGNYDAVSTIIHNCTSPSFASAGERERKERQTNGWTDFVIDRQIDRRRKIQRQTETNRQAETQNGR